MTLSPLLAAASLLAASSAAAGQPVDIATCLPADFSGSVLVLEGGEHWGALSQGAADLAGSRPLGEAARFNLGSASKMFTALAIAQLEEAGRLGLDDPVARHLPDAPEAVGRVTIRQLLNHTSGLGDYLRPENRSAITAARTSKDLLPVALAGPPPAPGAFRYSNSGYVVLGAIVEAISGQPYAEFVTQHIFQPAGMAGAGFEADPATAQPITRMGPGGAPRVSPFADMPASAAGGAFATTADLRRFYDALRAGLLVKPATLDAFLAAAVDTGRAPAGGDASRYGYGFSIGHDWFGHGGGAPGVNAEIRLGARLDWAVIVLANQDPPVATVAAGRLQNARATGRCV